MFSPFSLKGAISFNRRTVNCENVSVNRGIALEIDVMQWAEASDLLLAGAPAILISQVIYRTAPTARDQLES